jgi:hypothetical protein
MRPMRDTLILLLIEATSALTPNQETIVQGALTVSRRRIDPCDCAPPVDKSKRPQIGCILPKAALLTKIPPIRLVSRRLYASSVRLAISATWQTSHRR